METEKSSSVFTSVLVVIILLGLVIFYLTRDKAMVTTETEQGQTLEQNTQEVNQEGQSQAQTEANAELRAEIESLDTEFEDMNAEDLDM